MPISSLRISGTGLSAERARLDAIARNIANAQTTRTAAGGPYRRQMAVFESVGESGDEPGQPGGVKVARIVESDAPPVLTYNPGHPDADANGFVALPNVNMVEEMVDMIAAQRAYDANIGAANATKAMIAHAIELGRI